MWRRRALVTAGMSIVLVTTGCTGSQEERAPAAPSNTDEKVQDIDLCGITDFQPMLDATSGTYVRTPPVTVRRRDGAQCAVNIRTDRWTDAEGIAPYLSVRAKGFDSAEAAEEDLRESVHGDLMGVVPNWRKDGATVDGPTTVSGPWEEGVVVTGAYGAATVLFQAEVRTSDYRLSIYFNGESTTASMAEREKRPFPSIVDEVRPVLMELLEEGHVNVTAELERTG